VESHQRESCLHKGFFFAAKVAIFMRILSAPTEDHEIAKLRNRSASASSNSDLKKKRTRRRRGRKTTGNISYIFAANACLTSVPVGMFLKLPFTDPFTPFKPSFILTSVDRSHIVNLQEMVKMTDKSES
jgi:hypothetical protein